MSEALLTADLIADALRKSFAPLRCDVAVEDFGRQLRFEIVDEAGGVVASDSNVYVRHIDTDMLERLINTYRRSLRSRGYTLHA
jgi:hypothetical protein